MMPKVADRSLAQVSLKDNPVNPDWVVEDGRCLVLAAATPYQKWKDWKPPNEFGEWVRMERLKLRWTQEQLANAVSEYRHCTQRMISLIESGDRTPSNSMQQAIKDVLSS